MKIEKQQMIYLALYDFVGYFRKSRKYKLRNARNVTVNQIKGTKNDLFVFK